MWGRGAVGRSIDVWGGKGQRRTGLNGFGRAARQQGVRWDARASDAVARRGLALPHACLDQASSRFNAIYAPYQPTDKHATHRQNRARLERQLNNPPPAAGAAPRPIDPAHKQQQVSSMAHAPAAQAAGAPKPAGGVVGFLRTALFNLGAIAVVRLVRVFLCVRQRPTDHWIKSPPPHLSQRRTSSS